MFSLAERVHDPELMDTRTYPEPVVRQTLDFLSLTNRFFGGSSLVLKTLRPWSARWTGPVSVLDVGGGGGDIALALAAWARRRGRPLTVTVVDVVPEIAEIARG